ncbi:hypothetical protein [Vibrio coralliilyticus]|uniref:hypothetical protein n=1 Tax=Vibrio coralliilyticus TaxID=190893 RepID=UPI001560FF97|nr:hypothetical protein [Vibrio coralliilyticus]NRF12892.1 hypothetical protein [Vibrio coralliilyticus]
MKVNNRSLILNSILSVLSLTSVVFPQVVNAENYPPLNPFKNISVSTSGNGVIYANGNMQAELLITYDLDSGYKIESVQMKKLHTEEDLGDKGIWNVDVEENSFFHTIGRTSALISSNDKGKEFLYRYIRSSKVSTIDTCVELVAVDNAGKKFTQSTCDGLTNNSFVKLTSIEPPRINAKSVSVTPYDTAGLGTKNGSEFTVIDLIVNDPNYSGSRLTVDIPGVPMTTNAAAPNRNARFASVMQHYQPDSSDISYDAYYKLDLSTQDLAMNGIGNSGFSTTKMITESVTAPTPTNKTVLRLLHVRHFAQDDDSERSVFDTWDRFYGDEMTCDEFGSEQAGGNCVVGDNVYRKSDMRMKTPVNKLRRDMHIIDGYGTKTTVTLDMTKVDKSNRTPLVL